jgi:hypothetical protein
MGKFLATFDILQEFMKEGGAGGLQFRAYPVGLKNDKGDHLATVTVFVTLQPDGTITAFHNIAVGLGMKLEDENLLT